MNQLPFKMKPPSFDFDTVIAFVSVLFNGSCKQTAPIISPKSEQNCILEINKSNVNIHNIMKRCFIEKFGTFAYSRLFEYLLTFCHAHQVFIMLTSVAMIRDSFNG